MMPDGKCLIYDPNDINPYGRELAILLAQSGRDTVSMMPRRVAWAPDGLRVVRVLATNKRSDGAGVHLLLRIVGPLVAVLLVLLSGRVPVIVWTRDSWDTLVWSVLAHFKSVVFVYHNPVPGRDSVRLKGRCESALRQRAHAVVHTEVLRAQAMGRGCSTVSVVPHLPFMAWVKEFVCVTERPEPAYALYLGAVRGDKGASELEHLAQHLAAKGVPLAICGQGPLAHNLQALVDKGALIDLTGRPFVDDATLGRRVAEASLLVAPYTQVTQSGTVITALSAGLPSLAYQCSAFEELLLSRSMVKASDPDSLARLARAYMDEPWETWSTTAVDLQMRALDGWNSVLNRVSVA